jgi:rhamnose transport system ATP-binding protein
LAHPVLELRSISKNFGMTAALSDLSLALEAGQVHALVGENGAGKSTVIKIVTGIHQPSSGEIVIDGKVVTIPGAQAARDLGIAAVYQEPMVFPDLDVAENIFISARGRGPFVRRREQRRKARELIARIGISLDPSRMANGLTLAEQQVVEIARALSQDVRVLIMDEPTASLSAHEATQLRRIARSLAGHGVAVVYISHRLDEVFEIADMVTVLRDGMHISTRPVAEVTVQSMIADMVGREVGNYFEKMPSTARPEVLLEVKGLEREGVFRGIDFELHRGEVLCMAGLVGARRTDVALALFGIAPATGGAIRYKGRAVTISSPHRAIADGIAYVSEDRRKLGLAMSMSVRANISLVTLNDYLSRLGLIDRVREGETANAFKARLNIRTPDIETPVGVLSGGNQQKTMLAKWLGMKPDLLIFDEPTRGIDVGAKAEVHDLIRAFAGAGGAVLLISSDLPEVMAMGDRILVMREGRQMAVVDRAKATEQGIMALATGQTGLQEAS